MRLFAKTSLIYLFLSIILFVISGIVFYNRLLSILDEELTESLYTEKQALTGYFAEHNAIPQNLFNPEGEVLFDSVNIVKEESIQDTTLVGDESDDLIPLRRLTYPSEINGKIYTVVISKERFETDDLIDEIGTWVIIILIAFIVILFAANYLFSRIVFRPFFNSLKKIEAYDINRHEKLELRKTSTKEFSHLNSSLERLTEKISTDFTNLKMFTENASHELQTPLSIIQMQSELIIQDESIPEGMMERIMILRKASLRLAKINQSLLLLSKLENGQFVSDEKTDMEKLLKEKMDLFEDIIKGKGFIVLENIQTSVYVNMPNDITDILMTNLFSNALKYTPPKGKIIIELTNDYFRISNSGQPFNFKPDKVFERFFKGNNYHDSMGLGLAIVKKIADVFRHRVSYIYKDEMHVFTYSFAI